MASREGIYCLTNDRRYDQTVSLLESLRAVEPLLPVYLLPFDGQRSTFPYLQARYRVQVFDHPSLDRLEDIGNKLYPAEPVQARLLRKLAVFWGPLDRFLCLDSDVIVLGRLAELFAAFHQSSVDIVTFGGGINDVYIPGPFQDVMVDFYATHGFNTGTFMARRNSVTLEDIRSRIDDLQKALPYCAPLADQPVLNYVVDIKGVSKCTACDLVPDLATSTWATLPVGRAANGDWRVTGRLPPNGGRRVLFLHWAGLHEKPMQPNKRILLLWRLRASRSWRESLRIRIDYNRTLHGLNATRRHAMHRIGRILDA